MHLVIFSLLSRTLFITSFLFISIFSATAQSDVPFCEFASSDPDGDFWGWENNQTCRVDTRTRGPFILFDPETDQQINFEPLRFNRSDLANQTLTCVRENTLINNSCEFLLDEGDELLRDLSNVWSSKTCNGRFNGTNVFTFFDDNTYLQNFYYTLEDNPVVQRGPTIDLTGIPTDTAVGNWFTQDGFIRFDQDFGWFSSAGLEDFVEYRNDGSFIIYSSGASNINGRRYVDSREVCSGLNSSFSESSNADESVPSTPPSTPSGFAECIDLDGDGWGWDGFQSCLISDQNNSSDDDSVDDNNTDNETNTNSDCDYSDADLFDGWGWDPVARESCPPRGTEEVTQEVAEDDSQEETTNDACDYSDADLFNGWGWDPVARESCPPL